MKKVVGIYWKLYFWATSCLVSSSTVKEKVLKKLFKQVVQICQRLGMVSLGLVAIDGTKPAIGGQG